MDDSVADREASYTSLNRQSWAGEVERQSTDTTPLLRSQKARQTPTSEQEGREDALGSGRGGSASFSALDQKRQGLFFTRTVIGEVLVLAS